MPKPPKNKTLKKWVVDCVVDGKLNVESQARPTVCPINVAHQLNSVKKIGSYNSYIILVSENGTKYAVYVENNGQVKSEVTA